MEPLKKQVTSEISRGIAQALSFDEIARNISKRSGVAKGYAMRIARTEGHRIMAKATMDVAEQAKEEYGADLLKQWNAALDKRTRKSHARVDGEIREQDEAFSNGLKYPHDPSGAAAEVINCRCKLDLIPRWALDEQELERLKQRAEYYGLDKADSFKDFKKKYINITNDASYNNIEEMFRKGSTHRKTVNGRKVIDKPTFNKLTKDFLKHDGMIIRGKEAEEHLGMEHSAAYLPSFNTAIIRDDATISDVLEEMYHAKQDREKMYGSELTSEVVLKREIDAQKYLLSLVDKYDIPTAETELTKKNLKDYEEQLRKIQEEAQDEKQI